MATTPTNETQLTARILSAVRAQYPDVWAIKTHGDGYQRRGIPDLLFVADGRLLAVEVKHRKPGESIEHLMNRVSIHQRLELTKLRDAGAVAIVAWSVEQVTDALDDLLP